MKRCSLPILPAQAEFIEGIEGLHIEYNDNYDSELTLPK